MRAVGTCGTGRQLVRLANSSRRARDNILTLERRRRLWQVRACVCVSACVVLKPALRGRRRTTLNFELRASAAAPLWRR